MIEEIIKKLIHKLDFNWFNNIKKEFENNDLYVKELGKIFHEVDESYEDNNGEVQNQLITIDKKIEHYCWNNSIYQSFTVQYLAEQNELCLCGFDVSRDIFDYIDSCLLEINTIEEKYKLLTVLYKKIGDLFSEFIKEIVDEDYRCAIVHIKEMCLKEFFVKYKNMRDLNNLIIGKTESSKIDTDIKVVNNRNSINSKFKLKHLGNDVYDRIQDVLISLKNFNCIDQSTKKTQLNRLFTGKIPEEKILWIGDIDSFKYFIKLLEDEEKIYKLGKKKTLTLKNCFILQKNINYDFSSLKNIRSISQNKNDILSKIVDLL